MTVSGPTASAPKASGRASGNGATTSVAADESNGPPAKKKLKYQDNTTLKVLVGPSKDLFNVHKQFVCNVSPFFQGACNSQFKEALNDEVYLPEADPDSFDIFMEWVYARAIKVSKYPPSKESLVGSHMWWMEITTAYLLAHYLQSTAFGNALIDFVGRSITRKHVLQNPLPSVVKLIYSSTLGDCGLRKLFIALIVWRTTSADWKEESQNKKY